MIRELSIIDKIYGVSQLWKEAEYNFASWDRREVLNWDTIYKKALQASIESTTNIEYYKVLRKMYALLGDGHTYVGVESKEDYELFSPELRLVNFEERVFVAEAFGYLKDVIPCGSEITEVNGITVSEYLKVNIFPYVSSSTSHYLWYLGSRSLLIDFYKKDVIIKILSPDNKISEYTLKRYKLTKESLKKLFNKNVNPIEYNHLTENIEYISINNFMDKNIIHKFHEYINSFDKSDGLIIDIRKNSGGNSNIAMDIISILASESFSEPKWKSPKHISALKSWNDNSNNWEEGEFKKIQPIHCKKLSIPIVILIGNSTFSAAEDFLIALDSINLGVFVGQVTAGSSGNSVVFSLPGGLYGQVCAMKDLYPDGKEFVGLGIKPHIQVNLTLSDILEKSDSTLKKAIDVIKGY